MREWWRGVGESDGDSDELRRREDDMETVLERVLMRKRSCGEKKGRGGKKEGKGEDLQTVLEKVVETVQRRVM